MSDPVGDPFTEAGEYVLGTLDLNEMRQAEARQSVDPAFAEAVTFWEDRLTPLTALVPSVAAPSALWARLALATGLREPTADRKPRFWQGTTAAALLLAAAIAGVAFLPHQGSDVAGARFAAALAPLNVAVPFLAETTPEGQVVITNLGNVPTAPGRSLQLWELKAGAATPVSLGLLSGRTVLPKDAGPWDQTKLLVSEEPTGGSPTGQPTGPVLFGGQLSRVTPPGR